MQQDSFIGLFCHANLEVVGGPREEPPRLVPEVIVHVGDLLSREAAAPQDNLDPGIVVSPTKDNDAVLGVVVQTDALFHNVLA